jgi:hypothetical protein
MDKLKRKNIRYICFRLQTEARGGEQAKGEGILAHADEVKRHMESQSNFGGWGNFGVTWDVDEKAFHVVVLLKKSIESEWNEVVIKEAKEFPVEIKKKSGSKANLRHRK